MLLTLCIFAISLRFSVAETSSFTKTYKYPETRTIAYWPVADDRNFVYARCNDTSIEPDESVKCIVGIKFDAFEDTKEFTKECVVTLKPDESNKIVNMSMRAPEVYGFGKDKILLVWGQIEKREVSTSRWITVQTTVVHLFDECRNFKVKVKRYAADHEFRYFDVRPKVVTFKETYELVVKQCPFEEHYICKSTGYDILKFDSYNRKLSEPEEWPYQTHPYTNLLTSIEFGPQKHGYIMFSIDHTRCAVGFINNRSLNYERQAIFEISSEEAGPIGGSAFTITNGAIGFSLILNESTVVCWQADRDGKIHLKKQFSFQNSYETRLEDMYNMRKGGLLLAVSRHDKTTWIKGLDWFEGDAFYLMRVDGKGQLDSVKVRFENRCLTHLGRAEFAIVRLFENEKNQYCIARQCQSNVPVPGRLETAVKCYSSDEFSRCDDCIDV